MKFTYKLILVSMGMVCLMHTSQAQIEAGSFGYYNDALRYSQLQNFGSARITGLAGAGSVLGGDISATFLNPAGLGLFNRSQFIFTPGFSSNQTEGAAFGETNNDEANRFSITNLGVVINFNKGDLVPGDFRGGTLGITYNRTNNFKRNVLINGANNNNSIIDGMLQQADSFFPNELNGISQVGYDHYIINPDPNDETFYNSPVLGFPSQTEQIRNTGFTDQVNIAYGSNYKDKIYFGAGLGITSANYGNSRVFTEQFTNQPLNSFSIDERLDVSGTGVNFNLGLIIRPTDAIRFGISYTTPTFYDFNEEGDNVYVSDWNNYDVANFLDDNGNRLILEDTVLNRLETATDVFVSNFNLKTPARFNAGLAFFFNKSGFITMDVEHLNYANASISSVDFFAGNDNSTIENVYNSVVNIRLGGEYRSDIFRLRLGYAKLGDPYQSNFDDVELDRSRQTISGGVGLNMGKYFLDLSVSNTQFDESFRSYRLSNNLDSPLAIINHNITSTQLTFGLNF
jgi:hypothetical protein